MVELEGIGLHTGQPAKVRFFAEEGPVRLRVGGQTFRPLASRVSDTTRCTVLEAEGVRLMTVEHLLAALYLWGIWEGLLIEVQGPEVPILDGSAKEWMQALAAFPPRGPKPRPIPEPFKLQEDKSLVSVEPAACFFPQRNYRVSPSQNRLPKLRQPAANVDGGGRCPYLRLSGGGQRP